MKLGFIGLGLMGMAMARRLVAAGYEVTTWNRDAIKTALSAGFGARPATSVAEVVQASDVVMLCVLDTPVVEELVFGSGGIADNCRRDQVLVDFSSIDPVKTATMAARLEQATGTRWVDAPVSGGSVGARSGKLVVMAGGERETVDSLRPVLSHLSERVTYMGAAGTGQAAKVCNQVIVSCNVLVMAEVLALAESAGIDSARLPVAFAGGFADSIPLQLTGTRMANRDFEAVDWHVRTLAKDLAVAENLVSSLQVEAPMLQQALALMQGFVRKGYGDRDPSTLIENYGAEWQ